MRLYHVGALAMANAAHAWLITAFAQTDDCENLTNTTSYRSWTGNGPVQCVNLAGPAPNGTTCYAFEQGGLLENSCDDNTTDPFNSTVGWGSVAALAQLSCVQFFSDPSCNESSKIHTYMGGECSVIPDNSSPGGSLFRTFSVESDPYICDTIPEPGINVPEEPETLPSPIPVPPPMPNFHPTLQAVPSPSSAPGRRRRDGFTDVVSEIAAGLGLSIDTGGEEQSSTALDPTATAAVDAVVSVLGEVDPLASDLFADILR